MVEAGYMLPFLAPSAPLSCSLSGFSSSPGRSVMASTVKQGTIGSASSFLPKDPAKEKDMRLKELENGRLAMFAFSGIVTQAVITGKPWPFL